MANPTPLLTYAIAERVTLEQSRDTARAASLAAEKSYADAREKLGKANEEFAALEREVAQIRKDLAEVETPADGEKLLAQLSAAIVAMRAKNAEILAAEETAALARAGSERAGSDLKDAESLLTAADKVLAAAQAESDRRDTLVKALAAPPLSNMQQSATDALAADPFKKAEARIANDLPASLRTRAAERRKQELDALDEERGVAAEADKLASAEYDKGGGLVGKATGLRAEYERAADALGAYVGRAKERFEHALLLAARVAEPNSQALTDAQRTRINDAKLVTPGEAAALLEQARDAARLLLKQKEAALVKARLAAQAADIDPDTNPTPDVTKATTERNDAKVALTKAEGDYKPEHVKALDAWEAAVPDPTWRLFADLEEAREALAALKAAKPKDLTDKLADAETKLIAALTAAAGSARKARAFEAVRRTRAARVAFESSAAPRLTLSALRGDR